MKSKELGKRLAVDFCILDVSIVYLVRSRRWVIMEGVGFHQSGLRQVKAVSIGLPLCDRLDVMTLFVWGELQCSLLLLLPVGEFKVKAPCQDIGSSSTFFWW
jgi:hypothetical protein